MIKACPPGAVAAALLVSSPAIAAAQGAAPAWVITPDADSCRTELELTGASGASVPITLVSDGRTTSLSFVKAEAPERAFLPIRVDHKPFANLVLRQADGRHAAMQLSAETMAALRKGRVLQISWVADEPVQAQLAGSEQGLADLKTCGAQVAQRFQEQQAAQREAQARAQAEARAKAIADEQLAAAQAEKQAAEAEAQRNAAEAERLRAAADAERQRAQAQADAARYRAEEQARSDSYPPGYSDGRDGYGPYGGGDPYGDDPAYPAPAPYRRW